MIGGPNSEMEVVKRGKGIHECDFSGTADLPIGTVIRCLICGKRYRLNKVGSDSGSWDRYNIPNYIANRIWNWLGT